MIHSFHELVYSESLHLGLISFSPGKKWPDAL